MLEREEECAAHTVFLDKSGVRMGCILGGVHGEGVGDRVWSRILGIGGELCDGRGAACLG